MKDLRLFLAVVLSLILATTAVLAACGGDDDDDDDDDTGDDDTGDDDTGDDDTGDDDTGDDDTGDDDTGDDDDTGGSAFDECVDWVMSCEDVSQSEAELLCQWVTNYDDLGNDCIDEAFANFFDCLQTNVDCDDYDEDAYNACANAAIAEITGCF